MTSASRSARRLTRALAELKNQKQWIYPELDYLQETLTRVDGFMLASAAASYIDNEIEKLTFGPNEPGLVGYWQALQRARVHAQALEAALVADSKTSFTGELTAKHMSSGGAEVAMVSAELSGDRPSPLAWRADPAAPGPTCQRLVALAAHVLPEGHRLRYAEEFRADLREVPRRERFGHALRLVACAWELRRSLTLSAARAEEHR